MSVIKNTKLTKDSLVAKIRKEKGSPLIGVIGATHPSLDYRKRIGIKVGYTLRDYIENFERKKDSKVEESSCSGKIFTGGVEGVGVDIYEGVVLKSGEIKQEMFDDCFFVLIPEYILHYDKSLFSGRITLDEVKVKYDPPEEYNCLARGNCNGRLDLVMAGDGMAERREYMAEIADALVVVNGGYGTLDEAIHAINLSTPLIVLENSGGAASILGDIKNGRELGIAHKKQLEKSGIVTESLDTSYIHTFKEVDELTGILNAILQ